MVKFDPDYAMFGVIAGDIFEDIGDTVIGYTNEMCIQLYGDLRGKTVKDILCEISGSKESCRDLLITLLTDKRIMTEGKLSGKIVKYHSRIINPKDGQTPFVQAGIIDISESFILKKLLYGTSEALKRAAKAADEDTGYHVERINQYSGKLAELADCNKQFVQDISRFAQLHDIGKIRVADTIRLPRKLTIDEIEIIKHHSKYGGEMVAGLTGLEMAYNIALEHHEKWDGSGYPDGKSNNQISIEARIVAITDVFDALVSARPYKPAFSYERTRMIFEKGDGRVLPEHFDPRLLNLFLDNFDEFIKRHKSIPE